MTAEELASRLERAKKSGTGYVARCPAHEDREPSLSISTGDDGRILLHCHVGCTPDAIVQALGLTLSDLFPPETHGKREITARYPYHDEHGALLYEVVRLEAPGQSKTFRQRRPDGHGDWIWSLGSTRRVLYRLQNVNRAIANGDTIYIPEGEKDVASLEKLGLTATCNPGGAGKWRPEYTDDFLAHAARVVIIADRDSTGIQHARQVAATLTAHSVPHEIVQAAVGKDVSDHLAAGKSLEDLEPLGDHDDDPASDQPAHTWTPIPLTGDDDEDDQEPDRILGLIYPGKRHIFAGEPETGKSWAALIATLETIRAGKRAWYVDHEMNRRDIRNRLRALGATDQHLQLVTYIRPDEPLLGPAHADTLALIQEQQPALIVVDAFASTLATHGLDENSNADVEKWYVTVADTLTSHGAALVIVDHVAKDKDSRGGYSIGAQRKKGGADAQVYFEIVKPFGRGKTGLAKILTQKDRPGWLPRPKAAEMELAANRDGSEIAWTITHAGHGQDDTLDHKPFRPTALMERVSRRLEEHGEPASRTWVESNVKGRGEWVRAAIDLLVQEGHLTAEEGARRAVILSVERPYREAWDTPPSDSVPLRPDSVPDGVNATPSPPLQGGQGRSQQQPTPSHEPGTPEWLGQATMKEINEWSARNIDA